MARRFSSHAILFIVASAMAVAAQSSPAAARAQDAANGEADAPKTETPQRVKSIPHVNIRARDLRLTPTAREQLARIADRYRAAARADLIVTGGTRSTKRQAELMISKLDHGDDIEALYEQKAACREIIAAYRAASGEGKKKRRVGVMERVRAVIDAQVARGVYVSRHLQSGAIDVRSRGMNAAQEKALRAAVAAEPGVSLLDERESVEPHFHLNL